VQSFYRQQKGFAEIFGGECAVEINWDMIRDPFLEEDYVTIQPPDIWEYYMTIVAPYPEVNAVTAIMRLGVAALLIVATFAAVSRIRLHLAEWVLLCFLTLGLIFGIRAIFPPSLNNVAGMLGHLAYVIIFAGAAHRRTKILSLSLFYGVFTVIMVLLSGYITTLAFRTVEVVFGVDTAAFGMGLNSVFGMLVTAVITVVMASYAGKMLMKGLNSFDPTMKNKFANYLLGGAVITLLLFFYHAYFQWIWIDANFALNAVVYSLLATSYFAFFVFAMFTFMQTIQKQTEAQLLTDYTKTIESGYNEMRKFRHDHLDLLHGFVGFIDEGNTAMREYLQKNLNIAEKSLKVLDKNIESLQAIKIPELKGLLAVKFAHAQSEGIEVKIDIAEQVEDIPLERTDLCRIVGIMLENAIEELLTGGYERKLLEFGILLNSGNIVLMCRNTCKTPPPIQKIFTENFSTKGKHRGFGLYNLKQICKKSGNAWASAHANKKDMFTITITVMEE
jgi:two-component system sensor histidine kinase AgrC